MTSVVGREPPPFFRRGPAPLAQLLFFVALSLGLLIADIRFKYLELVRQSVAVVTYPLQQAAGAPVDALRVVADYFASVASLREENADMRRRRVEAAGDLLRLQQVEQDNQRLRSLLEMKQQQPVPGVVAEVVISARDPFARRVTIDKGTQHGIAAGQAVVDEHGVIGQVTRVYPLHSEVTLISDKGQAIPVQVERNGLRSVLFGTGSGGLELRFLAANADVQNGDMLVTSGLDGIYLPGLPVARVVRVERDDVYAFARIVCAPIGGVEHHRMVLVLGSREPLPEIVAAPEVKEKPVRSRRLRARE